MASEETEIRRRGGKFDDISSQDGAYDSKPIVSDEENVGNSWKNSFTDPKSSNRDENLEESSDFDTSAFGKNKNGMTESRQNAAEYADSVREWMLQYHSWSMMNHYSQMMAYNYMYQQFSAASNPPQQQQNAVMQNGAVPMGNHMHNNVGLHGDAQGEGTEYRVAPIWKRVVAELLDFFLLLLIKIGVACMLMDITGGLGLVGEFQPLDVESLLVDGEIDVDRLLNMTSELMAIEVINRIFISLFEAMCLRQGIQMVGGSTPGKRIMGLCVVSCQVCTDLPNRRVLVIPANNIGFWSALKRSFIKNFSLAFLFPMCLTALFFQNGQAAYDMLAQCIVVEDNRARPGLGQH